MRYQELALVYEQLESTTKKLEKRDILADLYKKCPDNLYKIVLLSMGVVVTGEQELGIASEMMKRIIAKCCGTSEKELTKKFKETGDLGLSAEFFVANKKQRTLAKKELTIDRVFENLEKLPDVTGSGSQDKKIALVSELISSSSPKEARYIVRTVLGEMRIGVAGGIVRDAIALTFDKDPKEVEHAFDVTGNYGTVAEMAKKGNLKAEIVIGKPLRVMLADRSPDLESAINAWDEPTATELKYDGFRIQIHKKDDKIKLFSRRLDDVTNQFPEIMNWSKQCLSCKECIVEGEVLALGKHGPLPFQKLSRRIQRKYDIDKMVKEIPVQVNLFELIYYNGESWMKKPLKDRWNRLKQIIKETKNFRLADHIETKNIEEANKFYAKSLKMGQEGVMVKNLNAVYQPGKRVGYWLKVKPVMEPLDLVIVGGTWGEGQRTKWIGSLLLAARKGKEFLPTGMMGSGLTEEQLNEVTKKLKKLITEEHGRSVVVKPQLVVEVGYEEIQKSPKYPSGFALRFPRLIRFREKEKKPSEADTVATIEKLYKQQRGRG